MEKWQITYLTKHMVELIEKTSCNAAFLASLESQDILSKADLSKLRAVGNSHGEYEQAMLLYVIIQTRVSAYEKTAKALYETKQSGAFKIFLEGLDNRGVSNPFSVCDINLDADTFLSTHAKFGVNSARLRDACLGVNKSTLLNHLKNSVTVSQYFDIFLGGSTCTKELVVVENTIPDPIYYYIPRVLAARTRLHKSVFKAPIRDIFIFKGIQRTALTELAHPNSTDLSSNQTEELTVRFILWENGDDVLDIVNLTKCPTHLISYDETNNMFNLERTWGRSRIVQNYLCDPPGEITEHEFVTLDYDTRSNAYIICDTPGMGKSVLLANIAREVARQDPDRFVVFIELSSFLKSMGRQLPAVNTSSQAMQLVVHYLTPTFLAENILMELLKVEHKKIDLFFDGFDEVDSSLLYWTSTFLKEIQQYSASTKLVIASRPHLRDDLETLLNVVSYTIIPLNSANQHEFLRKFWKQRIKSVDEVRLSTFVTYCIINLFRDFNKTEQMITGIPLQLFMIAEVYCVVARKYSTPGRKFPLEYSKTPFNSMFGMYQSFLKIRFSKETDPETRLRLKNFHIWTALKLLFPELAVEFVQLINISDIPSTEYLLSFGILEVCSTGSKPLTRFVHRTFTEYLVAECTAKLLTRHKYCSSISITDLNQISESLFNTVLGTIERELFSSGIDYPDMTTPSFMIITMRNPVIGYFINGFFHKWSTQNNSGSQNEFKLFCGNMKTNTTYQLLQSYAYHNYPFLVQFIFEGFQSIKLKLSNDFKTQFVQDHRGYKLLLVATKYSTLPVLESFTKLYSDIIHYSVWDEVSLVPVNYVTPLHLAVRQGSYQLVEYMLQYRFPISQRNLLHTCVYRTHNNIELIEEKISIIRLLLKRDLNLIHECFNDIPPLLVDYLHVNIIKELIKNKAFVYARNEHGCTVADKAAEYMTADDFHELVRFLLLDNGFVEMFKMKSRSGRTTLQESVRNLFSRIRLDTVEIISKIAGIDVYSTDCGGESLLFSAVKGVQNLDLLTFLLRSGSDVNLRNRRGQNILDAISQFDSSFAISAFCQYTPQLTATDRAGNNLLHLSAAYHGEELFHKCLSYVIDAKNYKLLKMKNALKYLPLEQAVRRFNILLATIDLILKSCDTTINDSSIFGDNILLLAAAIEFPGRFELFKTLVKLGINIQAQNHRGDTILHLVCMDVQSVHFFVESGANATVKNNLNETPLEKFKNCMKRTVKFDMEPTFIDAKNKKIISDPKKEAHSSQMDNEEEIIRLLTYAEKNNSMK